jgi:hypothetical protein
MDQDQAGDESHTIGDKGLGSGRVGGKGGEREPEREREVDRRASRTQKSIICSTANKPASVCVRRPVT